MINYEDKWEGTMRKKESEVEMNKEQWQKIGIYMIKYEDKWEGTIRKKESEVEMNLDKCSVGVTIGYV
jgi:hypothetical protein